MNKSVQQPYKVLFAQFNEYITCNETDHIYQDEIYRLFIQDICNNKLTTLTTLADIKKWQIK